MSVSVSSAVWELATFSGEVMTHIYWCAGPIHPLPTGSWSRLFLIPDPIINLTSKSCLLLASLLSPFFFCFSVPLCFSQAFLGYFQATRTLDFGAWLLLLMAAALGTLFTRLCWFMFAIRVCGQDRTDTYFLSLPMAKRIIGAQ